MTNNVEPTLPVSLIAPARQAMNDDTALKAILFGACWLGVSAIAILIEVFAISKNNSSGPKETGICLAIGFATTALGFSIHHYQDYLKACVPSNPCGSLQAVLNALGLSTANTHSNRDMLLRPLQAANEQQSHA